MCLSILIYCLIAKEASGPPAAPCGKLPPAAMPQTQTQSAANKQVCVHLGVCVCVCLFKSYAMPNFSMDRINKGIFRLSLVLSGQSQQTPLGP